MLGYVLSYRGKKTSLLWGRRPCVSIHTDWNSTAFWRKKPEREREEYLQAGLGLFSYLSLSICLSLGESLHRVFLLSSPDCRACTSPGRREQLRRGQHQQNSCCGGSDESTRHARRGEPRRTRKEKKAKRKKSKKRRPVSDPCTERHPSPHLRGSF